MIHDKFLQPIADENNNQIRDKVYNTLKMAILKAEIKPGDRLIERKLAEQLNVSRTPVREAIRMLELERLVSHLPRVGAVVTMVDDMEVNEIYRIRAVLEGLAARMAAERIKPDKLKKMQHLLTLLEKYSLMDDLENLQKTHQDFNDLIYESAESPRLYFLITSLVDHINRCTRVGYARPGRIAEAAEEHRRLVEAIRLRDGDLAERVAREHIENSRYAYFFELTKK